MQEGEFYLSSEYNRIPENKSIPPDLYRTYLAENDHGKELSPSAPEITTLQRASAQSKGKSAAQKGKALSERLLSSIKQAAATAVTAVAAIAVAVGVVFAPPQVALERLEVGYDSVSYSFSVDQRSEDISYYVLVRDRHETVREQAVTAEGKAEETVSGLSPDTEYSLLVVGRGTAGDVEYYQKTFRTLAAKPGTPVLTDLRMSGLNELSISFDLLGDVPPGFTPQALLITLTYPDGTKQEHWVEGDGIALGYTKTELMQNVSHLTATAQLFATDPTSDEEYCAQGPEKDFTPDTAFSALSTVMLKNEYVHFRLSGYTDGTHLVLVRSSENAAGELYDAAEGYIDVFYDTQGELQYTLCLADENGEPVGEPCRVTVNTAHVPPVYEYDYQNPGEVALTYNEDGTFNAYAIVNFSSDDPDVYCRVRLEYYMEISTVTRGAVAAFYNLPRTVFSLTYEICKDVDGVCYVYTSVMPSGMLGELIDLDPNEAALDGEVLTLSLASYCSYDLTRFCAISSSGETLYLAAQDLVENEEGGYTAELRFSTAPEWVTVRSVHTHHAAQQEQLAELIPLVGDRYMTVETVIYQP